MRVRAKAVSLATFSNRFTSFVLTLVFLSLQALNPAALFFSLGVIAILSAVFVHYCLPESKGKTLEEITAAFSEGYSPVN
jgi:hypothetical protein